MLNFLSKYKRKFKLLFTKSDLLEKKEKKEKKKFRNILIGHSLILIQIIITIIFLYLLFKLNIIPDKYIIALVIFLLLVTVYNVTSQYTKAHIFGKSLAVLLSITLFLGSFYIHKTDSMLSSITGNSVQTDYFSVIVLNTDPAETLGAAKIYPFAYNSTIDVENSQKVVNKINTELNTTLITTTYNNWDGLVNALYSGNIKAIIVNETYRSDIESIFSDFNDKTKILETIKLESKINVAKNVITEPFSIYIAGNDSYDLLDVGSSKNDVNIIATFNPSTRQILLVTTPRDYYIKVYSLTEKGIKNDKLTHAGNFGVDSSIETLNNLYGVNIDYYVRINFAGTVKLVDALGGITINSEIAFTTTPDTAPVPYTFTVGPNECNGERALAFCRERYGLSNGDNQRGRDQMFAIQGLISKASSPAILKNYSGIMDSLSGMFATNIPQGTLSSMIKDMLNDSTPWKVQTYNVTGTEGGSANSVFFGLYGMSVTFPDYNSVQLAIELMSKVKQGDVFDVNSYVENAKQQASSSAGSTATSTSSSVSR